MIYVDGLPTFTSQDGLKLDDLEKDLLIREFLSNCGEILSSANGFDLYEIEPDLIKVTDSFGDSRYVVVYNNECHFIEDDEDDELVLDDWDWDHLIP